MRYDRRAVINAVKHLVAVLFPVGPSFIACSSGIKKTTTAPFPLPPPRCLMELEHGYPPKRGVIKPLSSLQQTGKFLNTVAFLLFVHRVFQLHRLCNIQFHV